MSHYRITAVTSPFIEQDLQQHKYKEVDNFISDAIKLCEEFENFLVLLIPNELKQYFYCDILKMKLTELEDDPQSKVIFVSNSHKQPDCEKDYVSSLFTGTSANEEISHRFLINKMYKNQIPIIFDHKKRDIQKHKCTQCDKKYSCSLDGVLSPCIQEVDDIRDFIKNFKKTETPSRSLTDSKTIEDIKYSAAIQGFLCGVTVEKLKRLNQLLFAPSFKDDLSNVSEGALKNLSFSILRCFFYPSIRDVQRADKLSIDWHPCSKSDEIKGIELYRCDVLPPDKTGKKSGSGKKRVMFGKVNGTIWFLAYTEKHDFSSGVLEKRCNEAIKAFERSKKKEKR